MPGALFRRLEGPCPLWRSRIIGPSDRARVYARPDDLYESGKPSRNVLLEYNKQPAITLSACLLRTDSTKTWHIGDWLKHSARRVSYPVRRMGLNRSGVSTFRALGVGTVTYQSTCQRKRKWTSDHGCWLKGRPTTNWYVGSKTLQHLTFARQCRQCVTNRIITYRSSQGALSILVFERHWCLIAATRHTSRTRNAVQSRICAAFWNNVVDEANQWHLRRGWSI